MNQECWGQLSLKQICLSERQHTWSSAGALCLCTDAPSPLCTTHISIIPYPEGELRSQNVTWIPSITVWCYWYSAQSKCHEVTNSFKSIDVCKQFGRLDFTSLLSFKLGKHMESLKRFNRVGNNRETHKWELIIDL